VEARRVRCLSAGVVLEAALEAVELIARGRLISTPQLSDLAMAGAAMLVTVGFDQAQVFAAVGL